MKAAIYCRLSKEDEYKIGESESIQNQKSMLIQYAIEKGFDIYQIYSDEDYSGIDRNRPAFNSMIQAASEHKFDVVLAKTQSRFTRDMELVEKYLHGKFIEWGIRFIAVVDHVDTNDTANKKSRQINGLINEWYLEDLSTNVRSVLDHKRKEGLFIGSFARYGYCKDPNAKGKLIIDPEAAEVVRRIFSMALSGIGAHKIARILNDEKVPSPTAYKQQHGIHYHIAAKNPNAVLWSSPTVYQMLHNQLYVGDMVQGRHKKVSYKSEKTIWLPQSQWIVVENTHEAIIDVELWNAVQKIRSQRRRPTKMGEMGMFSGLTYCADCGAKLYHCRTGSWAYEQECYNCSTQKSHKGCFGHYIRAVVLEQLVLQNLQRVIAYVQEDENEFARLVMRNQTAAQAAEQMQTRRLLEKNTRRMNELDTIIQRLYEDNISGKLTDERFKKLSEAYEQEQTALRESVPALAAQLQDADDKMLGVQHFLKAVRKYTQPEKLTAAMLRELVEKVVVYAPDKSSGHRVQRIDVYYTFIGKIDFSPEYSKKGTA